MVCVLQRCIGVVPILWWGFALCRNFTPSWFCSICRVSMTGVPFFPVILCGHTGTHWWTIYHVCYDVHVSKTRHLWRSAPQESMYLSFQLNPLQFLQRVLCSIRGTPAPAAVQVELITSPFLPPLPHSVSLQYRGYLDVYLKSFPDAITSFIGTVLMSC